MLKYYVTCIRANFTDLHDENGENNTLIGLNKYRDMEQY